MSYIFDNLRINLSKLNWNEQLWKDKLQLITTTITTRLFWNLVFFTWTLRCCLLSAMKACKVFYEVFLPGTTSPSALTEFFLPKCRKAKSKIYALLTLMSEKLKSPSSYRNKKKYNFSFHDLKSPLILSRCYYQI